ncbi:MAG: Holliday junction resolvase RuvX [Bacillota bacterium]|jgi:putative Holliday junction resolvase
MRIIALDVGTKNIGMAVCDPLGITAQSLETIRRKGDLDADVGKVAAAAKTYGAETIVVGLPKNMNGSEGPSCEMAKSFAAEIEKVLPTPIVFWDERLTSRVAEQAMIGADVSRKKRKQKVDALAAILILQNYLDYLKRGEPR